MTLTTIETTLHRTFHRHIRYLIHTNTTVHRYTHVYIHLSTLRIEFMSFYFLESLKKRIFLCNRKLYTRQNNNKHLIYISRIHVYQLHMHYKYIYIYNFTYISIDTCIPYIHTYTTLHPLQTTSIP